MTHEPVRLAGGGSLLKALVDAVAKEAPELARGASGGARAMLNVGLDINGGEKLAPEDVMAALEKYGVKPLSAKIAQSDTEPTLVLELDRSLKPDEAHSLSEALRQEAIAQVDEHGVGDLHGPSADNWRPFNGDYFIKPDGSRLGSAAAPVEDPVMAKLQEYADGLDKPVKKAGGGIIGEAVEALTKAAVAGDKKVMRLYHGRAFREPIKQLDPLISPNQLGIHLGDAETASRFAPVRDYVRPNDAGGRVIPLDVTLQNPIRLMDNNGRWEPGHVYKQLVDQGRIPHDRETESRLHWGAKGYTPDEEGTLIEDESAPLNAMLEIQDIIRSLGHDGVVYKNRYEMPEAAMSRAEARGMSRDQINGMTEEDFNREFPDAPDSYIAFRREQLKSPFGDGPGVGYAGGGVVRKLGQGLVDLLDFSGVVGRPSHVVIPGAGRIAAAPIGEIDDAAEAYMKRAGIPGTHRIDAYPKFDEDFAVRLAKAYEDAKHAPNDPEVRRAYEALMDETMAQYHALKDTGLDVKFLKDGMTDPYAKSPAMGYADMVKNGRLWVFPTEQGYGSLTDIADNPLLKKVGKVGDLDNATANDAFRVVHDAYGHYGPGNPFFRHAGEDRAWQHHARMFSDDALPAMTAETRGQNSWLNFGPHGEKNRSALGADTIFADQKATIMPSWAYDGVRKYADGGSVSPEEADAMTHWDSYGVGSRPSTLKAFGNEFDLGEGPVYYTEGTMDEEGRAPLDNVQDFYDAKTVPFYFTPASPIAGASDFAEGMLSGDPLTMAVSVAGSIPGKVYKAGAKALYQAAKKPAVASALAAGAGVEANTDEAEAGIFGRAAKWATGSEGKDALNMALKMYSKGAGNGETFAKTTWFRDVDGHWKFWKPSTGGGLIEPFKGGRLADVYRDPFLFDEYPHMKDIGFRRSNEEGAWWDEPNNEIVLGDTSKPFYNTPKMGGRYGALTHEIYHAKSSHEGWPQGTSTWAARDAMANDIRKLHNIPPGGPVGGPNDKFSKVIGGVGNYTPLGYKRYLAEAGEALARREAAMREYRPDNLRGVSPAAQSELDMPADVLFHPGQTPMMEQYNALLKLIEDERVAADMQAAAAVKPKTKGRR